jgi:hypothetical protein
MKICFSDCEDCRIAKEQRKILYEIISKIIKRVYYLYCYNEIKDQQLLDYVDEAFVKTNIST